jgi:hypothetical protein
MPTMKPVDPRTLAVTLIEGLILVGAALAVIWSHRLGS